MKKLLSIIITVVLILNLFAVTALADNKVVLTLEAETGEVYAGEEFTVNLTISDNSKLAAAVIDLNYDASKLEYIDASVGGIVDSSAMQSINKIEDEKTCIRFSYLSTADSITAEGVLMTVKFKALDNAEGTANLTVSISNPADFVAEDLSRIEYTVKNTVILIKNDNIPKEESSTEIVSTTQAEEKTTIVNENENTDDNDGEDYWWIIAIVVFGIVVLGIAIVMFVSSKKKKEKEE